VKRSGRLAAFSLGDVGAVLCVSAAIVLVFVVVTAAAPDAVQRVAQALLHATAANLGWMYLLVTTGFVGFVLVLGLSDAAGDIVLVGPDAPVAEGERLH